MQPHVSAQRYKKGYIKHWCPQKATILPLFLFREPLIHLSYRGSYSVELVLQASWMETRTRNVIQTSSILIFKNQSIDFVTVQVHKSFSLLHDREQVFPS